MSDILFDISGKVDLPCIAALRGIKQVADSLGIAVVLVGATARDILLAHLHGIVTPRKTLDLDLGVEVADWDQHRALISGLLATGGFSQSQEKQRLHFTNGPAIDIVPFGPISGEAKTITWPPEGDRRMVVSGFEEAYENSVTARLSSNPTLDINVPSLPGLAILKLISWDEAYPDRPKDAEDMLFIMNTYERAGNEDRLFSQELELVADEDYDIAMASIRLLGRDMVGICKPSTFEAVAEILKRETEEPSNFRLVSDMARHGHEEAEQVLHKVEKLCEGFSEVKRK